MGIRSGMLRRMIWILVAPAAVWAVYAVWRAEAKSSNTVMKGLGLIWAQANGREKCASITCLAT